MIKPAGEAILAALLLLCFLTPIAAARAQEPRRLLPDLQTLPLSELNIQLALSSGRKMLRLTNSIANLGPGPLELRGVSDPLGLETQVTQHIHRTDGEIEMRPAGVFVYHPGHHHWHFENFVRYELWSLTPSGAIQNLVSTADKVSYCLRDNSRAKTTPLSVRMGYIECEQELQGLSPGWIDTYRFDRPGQVLDITGLPDGRYALRSIVDPANQIVELNESNNAAMVYIAIQRTEVSLSPPEHAQIP